MANGNAIVYPGELPANTPNLGTLQLSYVRPVPDASHHWSSRQLVPGRLTEWRDRIGGAVLAPPSGGQAPVVYAGQRKVVRFAGSPERVGVSLDLTGPLTFAIVAGLQDTVGTQRQLTYGLEGGTFWNIYEGVNGNWAFSAGQTLASTQKADNGRHVFLVSYDGPNSVLRIDDKEWAGNAGLSPASGFRIGSNATTYFKSDVEAIVVLPYAASLERRTSLVAQLKAEHGFTF